MRSGDMVKESPNRIGSRATARIVGTWAVATGGLIARSDVYHELVDNYDEHEDASDVPPPDGRRRLMPTEIAFQDSEASIYLKGGARFVDFYVPNND